jgi:hypothetical protein
MTGVAEGEPFFSWSAKMQGDSSGGAPMKSELRVSASVVFALLLCALPLSQAGCAGSADANQIRVTYYYLPGCAECEKVSQDVAALERDFPGQVRVERLASTEPEAARMVQMLGFKEHGLVIRSHRGAVLWKESSHAPKMGEVREQLKNLLAFQQQAAL